MSTATVLPESALGPRRFIPTWELALSLFGHGAVVLGLFVGECMTRPDAPLIDPNKVMMVSAVALPKQVTRLPQKAMHTPEAAPGAADDAAPIPPTASDMTLHDEKAPEKSGRKVDRTADREALLRQARKDALLKDLATPTGPEDHARTDPHGVDPSEAVFGAGGPGVNDPVLARYQESCRAAIYPNWTPLPSTVASHPEFEVWVEVEVKADGSIGTPRVVRGTGDTSFDRSALMAVAKTGRLPPPPEKWRASAATGIYIILYARDKR